MKVIGSFCILLVLAGCASAPEKSLVTNREPVCERYYPTGSNLPKTRCFTADEWEQQQRAVEEMTKAIDRAHTTGSNPSGK